jgi:hypothetical protein
MATMVSSSDRQLMSRCPSLLWLSAATVNLMPDYQLLMDRFRFRHSQIQIYQVIIIRHIDRNWLNTSSNTCSHREIFIIEHHTNFVHNITFLYISWYIYSHPQISLNFKWGYACCGRPCCMQSHSTGVTPHVSNPHDYVNHMFKRH